MCSSTLPLTRSLLSPPPCAHQHLPSSGREQYEEEEIQPSPSSSPPASPLSTSSATTFVEIMGTTSSFVDDRAHHRALLSPSTCYAQPRARHFFRAFLAGNQCSSSDVVFVPSRDPPPPGISSDLPHDGRPWWSRPPPVAAANSASNRLTEGTSLQLAPMNKKQSYLDCV